MMHPLTFLEWFQHGKWSRIGWDASTAESAARLRDHGEKLAARGGRYRLVRSNLGSTSFEVVHEFPEVPNRRQDDEISPDPLRFGEAGAREALLADLADEHGCAGEDAETERLTACEACCERAVRLAARLAHEGLLRPPAVPSCSGSLRTPQRATTLPHGAEWGTCRECGKWMPLSREDVVKPHLASVVISPGEEGSS